MAKPKLKTLEQIAQDPVWLTRYRSWRELRRSEGKPTDKKYFDEWDKAEYKRLGREEVARARRTNDSPRAFYASAEGWDALQKMLNEEGS
jgi:hypothetical protein